MGNRRSISIQKQGWIDKQQVERTDEKCAGWMKNWLELPLLE